jgi:hypothetical protein
LLDSLESKILEFEAENEELRSRPIATPAIIASTPPPLVKVSFNAIK